MPFLGRRGTNWHHPSQLAPTPSGFRRIRVGRVEILNNKRVESIHSIGHSRSKQILIDLSLDNKALDKCRESPPTDWPAAAYVLVGREDLAMSCLGCYTMEQYSQDRVNLVSIAVPYMLHLQPVTMPSSFSDVAKSEEAEPPEDGMGHIFNSSTQLRYGCDLRLNEVRRLLCSARPVAIQTSGNPSASDQDLQQHQLWNVAQRTTALPFGRGAFTLATTHTLLTEKQFLVWRRSCPSIEPF